LRSEWLYNNWMYALVGVIIGRHSKEGNYLDFMKKRLLDEYGLTRSCIQRKDVADGNISLAYAASESGKPMELHEPPWEESPFTPGGGIRSCVLDMLTWARSLLQAYKMESRDLSFRSDAWEGKHPGQIFSPRMILPDPISHGQLERSYGLGFMRFMLPSALSYGGRNSTVAEKVSIPHQ
jgi:CubicO group peptidase (beta-lactamase class C family)